MPITDAVTETHIDLPEELSRFLKDGAAEGLVPWALEREAALRFGLDARAVEAAALDAGLFPARYGRNRGLFGLEGQRALHRTRVLVAGCGGLGGHLVEGLARLGVGRITAVDPDSFDESNLNRQLLCTLDTLGRPKADAAAARVAAVNPACRVIPLRERLCPANADTLLEGVDLALDGLDSVSAREALSDACARSRIPLVHAAVAGWYGQASVQPPGSPTVVKLYENATSSSDYGDERSSGNQAFGPALAAAIQLAQACAIILEGKSAREGRLLCYDLLSMSGQLFDIG